MYSRLTWLYATQKVARHCKSIKKKKGKCFSLLMVLIRRKIEAHTLTHEESDWPQQYNVSQTFVCSIFRSLCTQINYSARTWKHRSLLWGQGGSRPVNALIARLCLCLICQWSYRINSEVRKRISTFSKAKQLFKISVKEKNNVTLTHVFCAHATEEKTQMSRSPGQRTWFHC